MYYIILFLFSIILSMFGFGGGVFYTPFFHILGYNFNNAATNSQVLIFFTSASASISFLKHKQIKFKKAFELIIFMMLGAFMGSYFSKYIPIGITKLIFIIVILYSIYRIIFPKTDQKSNIETKKIIIYPLTILFGSIAGLIGIGGGVFLVPLLKNFYKFSIKQAIATSSFIISISSTMGIIGHISNGALNKIDSNIVIYILTVTIGAFIGPKITLSIKKDILTKIYLVLLIIITILTIIK